MARAQDCISRYGYWSMPPKKYVDQLNAAEAPLRTRIFEVIFESDAPAAKGFDIALIAVILASVVVVLMDSVPALHARYATVFWALEWTFTVAFTVEYALRLYCLQRPWLYARSFYGVIDLLSILPTWLSFILPGAQPLLVVRILRVLRLFRVLRLMEFVGEGELLLAAMHRSKRKILLFLASVLLIVTVFGATIYLIEPPEAGFTSIPRAMYWGVVTLTTVGYGDIAPITPLGQFVSALMMIIGYSIIAVPTGVFSAEVIRAMRDDQHSDQACPGCGEEGHDRNAKYCKLCGHGLDEDTENARQNES